MYQLQSKLAVLRVAQTVARSIEARGFYLFVDLGTLLNDYVIYTKKSKLVMFHIQEQIKTTHSNSRIESFNHLFIGESWSKPILRLMCKPPTA